MKGKSSSSNQYSLFSFLLNRIGFDGVLFFLFFTVYEVRGAKFGRNFHVVFVTLKNSFVRKFNKESKVLGWLQCDI